MPKRLSRKQEPDDGTQSAFRALQHVIDQTEGPEPKRSKALVIPIASGHRKNPAAVALGRKGGLKSAQARMEKIPEAERRRIASVAARARWAKEKGDH